MKKLIAIIGLAWIVSLGALSQSARAWPHDWPTIPPIDSPSPPTPPPRPEPTHPNGCAAKWSACSSIVPCCAGLTCQRVGSGGTRYDWQCR